MKVTIWVAVYPDEVKGYAHEQLRVEAELPGVPRVGDFVEILGGSGGGVEQDVKRVWWSVTDGTANVELREFLNGKRDPMAQPLRDAGWQ